jgi:hypothetical protein
MTKHTPGPWRLSHVEEGSIKHLVPVDAGGTSLLTVVNERGYDGCGEPTPFAAVYSDEDARLMAAAPELLAAVRLLLTELVFTDTAGTEAAHAAIFKATGEQS